MLVTEAKKLPFKERAKLCSNPVAKKLFTLMEEKKSNLALSADVRTAEELLYLADAVGPEISVLKTHIDIIDNFNTIFLDELRKIAKKHRFILFEDRKFGDIGNTVKAQYSGGLYKIADWAEITNAHPLPGEGVIQGLKEVGLPKNRALLLLAQMSSKGTMTTEDYAEAAVKMAKKHDDFVIGFVCQQQLLEDPRFIHMTPGVNFDKKGDTLGQQYRTPEVAIQQQGCDMIIVGRAIIQSKNPHEVAKEYRRVAYTTYTERSQ